MDRECGIHKSKNRKVLPLVPPSRGRDTLLFVSKQILFSRNENPTDFQTLRSMCEQKLHPPSRCRDTFPLLCSKSFYRKKLFSEVS